MGPAIQQLTGILLLTSCIIGCSADPKHQKSETTQQDSSHAVSLIVLGTVQDGGSPHIGCTRECCTDLFTNPDPSRKVVSLGVVDRENKQSYIFEATPDFPAQMRMLKDYRGFDGLEVPDGIFLTHAHIGHYAGLMFLGKEAMHADSVPVYAMPRMKTFLEENGPWSQLVTLQNIAIQHISSMSSVQLTPNLLVTPFTVPHRDEYSETAGYMISGPSKTALFIPDIDKWEKWDENIEELIASVDYAFLDATFYDGAELNNRDMSEIPHPFVVESMQRFEGMPASEKAKVYFIHLNHTNPLLDSTSTASERVRRHGFNVARFDDVYML